MRLPRVLAIVQAGGAGGRMDVLTIERAKPALPFAGSHQLLDFALSNLTNSGIQDVWLTLQYQASTLEELARNGRPWDLDRTYGGLRLLVPQQGSGSTHDDGMNAGNADELYALRDDIRRDGADVVLVMSADHAYRMDYRDVVATHLEHGAEATVVTYDLAGTFADEPGDHAVVQVDGGGRVTAIDYKPERPASSVIAAEVTAYDARVLVEVLEELHRELAGSGGPEGHDDDSGLDDFGDHLLPRLVERGSVHAHRLDGYWRDLGQPHHYLNAHLELIGGDTGLFDRSWPLRSQHPQRQPARVADGAVLADALLSPGCDVAGTVRRSVLGPGVVVEAGAVVEESVLFADTVVRAGARVRRTVVDSGCELLDGADVGGSDVDLADPDAIPLVGRDSRVSTRLPAGARLLPGTTA
ncbi:glucose-1-phosphate adenylyltransferase family protein [Nocardioides ferulae]|uniref:glucose-1-phosphate adenylyltransferase family protein n=1 Tax=Nocardioides ferulae TaxID=2340821 RepID=UPI000EADDDF5|nr:sugar phosphate nucleotidyltransferase [Nocardioides ferulae]